MNVDASLTALGGFGWMQVLNFLLYTLCGSIAALQITGVIFTVGEPDGYRCHLPPNETSSTDGGPYFADECSLVYDDPDTGENVTTPCLYGWDYESVHGETSFVTDVDLVCDRAILTGTLTSIHFGGCLVGAFVLGQLSDIFGRRIIALISIVGTTVTGTGLSFVWNYGLMAFVRFICGMFIQGLVAVTYVRIIEMLTPSRRLRGQVCDAVMWSMGIALLAPLAYLLPSWRHLQLAMSLIYLPFIPLVWFSFESIRWLVQKGRVEEAEDILQNIAKSKNISHPGHFLVPQRDADFNDDSQPAEGESIELEPEPAGDGITSHDFKPGRELSDNLDDEASTKTDSQRSPTRKATVLDLFKTRVLIIQTLIVFYCWFVSSIVYYGFFINSANLVGNKYLNFFLISITETPSYIVNFFVMTRFGRRRPLMLYYIVSGVACVVTGVIPTETAEGTDLTTAILVVAMIGKFFSSAAFDTLYLVTAEVFPTVLRNAAVGASSMVGRVGGMVAPFIVYLNVVHNSIPMIVFGVVSLLAGVLIIPLPETSNRSLPETLDDGTKLARKEGLQDGTSPTHA